MRHIAAGSWHDIQQRALIPASFQLQRFADITARREGAALRLVAHIRRRALNLRQFLFPAGIQARQRA